MAFSVQMPELGESVTEGTVTRWLKQEGDTLEIDEPLVEVSTDKVDTEIPSPAAGVLTKIIAHEDDTVEVGGELALIGDPSEAGTSEVPAQAPNQPQPEAEAPPQPEPEPEPAAAAPQDYGGGTTTPVLMPELGESVTEGTVTRWLKKVGDSVQLDEPLVEVATDKVDTEIPSPVAGVLVSITADEDATVPVGGELARIGAASDTGAAPAPAPAPKPEPKPEAAAPPPPAAKPTPSPEPLPAPTPRAEPAPPQPAAETGADGVPYMTPLVRKLATENNIDLAEVTGTGAGGRVRKQDVLAAAQKKEVAASAQAPAAAPAVDSVKAARAAAPTPAPALAHLRGTTQKANRIRQLTAKKTRESLQATAQLTQTHEVDMTKIVALRARAKNNFAEREGVNLTYLPFFAVAVVDALKAHPNVNASYNEETKEITYYDAEHLGFAVDTDQGLLSPVIHNAGDLSLGGLARAIADIAARARSGNLKPDELSGGTFTITNIGSQGALFDTPIPVPSSNGRGWSLMTAATNRSGSARSAISR
jgi:2-oxoglutarate dehydrogenase E2 component (dihydrolipoamide succinyltransferase)